MLILKLEDGKIRDMQSLKFDYASSGIRQNMFEKVAKWHVWLPQSRCTLGRLPRIPHGRSEGDVKQNKWACVGYIALCESVSHWPRHHPNL